jgi:tetratricopeptide (TPR) repeat protein
MTDTATKDRRTRRLLARTLFAGAVGLGLGSPAVARADCSSETAVSYAAARRAFEEKRYDASVGLLRKAYACDPNPVYLANIARAYEEAGRRKEAVAAWREYLGVVTDERERKFIEGRISSLIKMLEDVDRLEREKAAAEEARRKAEASSTQHPSPSSPPQSGKRVSTVAAVITGAGAAGLATGAVLA